MILVTYWKVSEVENVRCGMLAWRELPDGRREALGGIDISDPGGHGDQLTVIQTDNGGRSMSGWVHPDNIHEISGLSSGK